MRNFASHKPSLVRCFHFVALWGDLVWKLHRLYEAVEKLAEAVLN